jgi:Ca2+-binding RTX toxin-like protein
LLNILDNLIGSYALAIPSLATPVTTFSMLVQGMTHLMARAAIDSLYGGEGDDQITAGAGDVKIVAEAGDDRIVLASEFIVTAYDTVDGGAGNE